MEISFCDAAVLLVYLCLVVLWGMWIGRGRQDVSQYLLGGRNAPWWAVLGSIVATETSTVTFLSVPGLAFAVGGDLRFLQLSFGYILGRGLVVWMLLPLYFRGELLTAYEVLEKRFGGATQRVASLIFLVTRNLGDGLRLYLTALVLEQMLGWSLDGCVVVIGAATILFTFVGGMKAVIWNDCIQLLVYMLGGVLALAMIVSRLPGGAAEMFDFAARTGRLRLIDLSFDPTLKYTLWAGLIGGATLTLGTHGTDQMMVQRLLAARSQADAGRALVASGLVVAGQFTLFLFVGIALACFYALPAHATEFPSSDYALATYIVTELPAGVGLIGLLLAAVFSAAMSTLSSSLNSSAAAVVNDWVLPWAGELRPGRVVWISRLLTVAFGVVQIFVGIGAQFANDAVINNALAIAGFSAGLLLGLFCLGLAARQVDQASALVGLSAGLVALLVVNFCTRLAWPWFPAIGAATTFTIGCLTAWSRRLIS